MPIHTAFISIGSNLGDKRAHCEEAVLALGRDAKNLVVDQSPYYRTEPIGYADQDWFLNAVLRIRTDYDPHGLLRQLLHIEQKAGRTREGIRFGPRTLDMDILLYEDVVLQETDLIIPHPRMHERRFVLQPLCDLAPNWRHPLFQVDIHTLLQAPEVSAQRIELL